MFKIPITQTTYDTTTASKVLNKNFISFVDLEDQEISVTDFFRLYERLFLDIPKQGALNSHQYLIQKSSEYIQFEADTQDLLPLLEEITSLREENLQLQNQIIDLEIKAATPV
jgi:hypothetical protein